MDNTRLSRRAFMRFGVAAMGTAAAAPLSGTLDMVAPHSRTLRVGVLLPQARYRPLLSANILDGLRLGFAGTAYQAQFITKQTRGTRSDATAAAEALLETGVDVVVGMVASTALDAMQDVFGAAGATFVQMTAGENIDSTLRPNIAVNTLQYAQSAYAAGMWAVQSLGRRGVILAALHESGYDTVYAAHQGIEAAGGSVARSMVTHAHPTMDRLTDAVEAVRSTSPDFIYAAYSGPHAAAFMAMYNASGLHTPLVVSPFMLDDIGYHPAGMHTVSAWSADIDSEANRAFLAAFADSAGRRPDTFAMLGYETAQWIASGLATSGTPSQLLSGLAAAQIASPRGALTFDASSHALTGGFVQRSTDGLTVTLAPVEVQTAARAPELRTGWTTPYLTA